MRCYSMMLAPVCVALVLSASTTTAPETRRAPDSPIVDAAMQGDTDAVRALIAQGADVNAAQGDGMTALHWAAHRNDVATAQLLLYSGANLNARTRIGAFTPLLVSSRMGSVEVLQLLLEAGADPNAPTTTAGTTPLHFAAAAGDRRAIELLVEHGAEIDARENGSLHTPLMFAAAYGNLEAAKALLALGADPSLTNEAIDLAERENEDRELLRIRERRVAFLLELEREAEGRPAQDEQTGQEQPGRGEGEAAQQPEQQPERQADEERAAAPDEEQEDEAQEDEEQEQPEEEAQEMEEQEPPPLTYAQLVRGHGGFTALHLAARQGKTGVVRALLDAGADIDQVSEGDHTTPLLIATVNGHWDLALELLARGADPNIASDAGATPLYAVINLQWAPAAFYPQPRAHLNQQVTYLEAMEALLEAGADPNARLERHLWYKSYNFDLLGVNSWGATPFWRAAYGTDVEAMKLLVRYGADPATPTRKPAERRRGYGPRNTDDDDGEGDPSGLPPVPFGGPSVTPLHAAAGAGYGQGRAGNSHRHVPGGWLPAVKYLVEEHALDVNARDHHGYNPVHHAAARGDNEMIRYLVDKGADVTAISRSGQTTADMANGPVQRISPFPETVRLLVSLGSKNNNNCQSC